MEAGTGIEPVYTDLQSNHSANENNCIDAIAHQDKDRTRREPDTRLFLGHPDPENENSGALAGATGAIQEVIFKGREYRKPVSNAMSKYAKDRHKRAARMLGYALTIGTPDAWNTAGFVFGARLTTAELASIAYSALRALDPDDREMTFNAAHWGAI